MYKTTQPFLFALLSIVMTSAFADGQVEINQASVDAGGGFPVFINSPGSYVLTGSLKVPDENTTAIQIAADDVTLDLNGFSITGVTTCSRNDVGGGDFDTICADTGSGDGIAVTGARVVIRNGTIRGMGNYGVHDTFGGPAVRVEGVTVTENGNSGIRLFAEGIVRNCRALRNGVDGISAPNSSIIADNLSVQNGSAGILATGVGEVIRGNTVVENDTDGIAVSADAVITQNVISNNERYGLNITAFTGYYGNTIRGSGTSDVVAGVNLGHNMCGGAPCP